jgi:peptidase E
MAVDPSRGGSHCICCAATASPASPMGLGEVGIHPHPARAAVNAQSGEVAKPTVHKAVTHNQTVPLLSEPVHTRCLMSRQSVTELGYTAVGTREIARIS